MTQERVSSRSGTSYNVVYVILTVVLVLWYGVHRNFTMNAVKHNASPQPILGSSQAPLPIVQPEAVGLVPAKHQPFILSNGTYRIDAGGKIPYATIGGKLITFYPDDSGVTYDLYDSDFNLLKTVQGGREWVNLKPVYATITATTPKTITVRDWLPSDGKVNSD